MQATYICEKVLHVTSNGKRLNSSVFSDCQIASVRILISDNRTFFVHTAPEELRNATNTCHFRSVFEENSIRGKSRDYRDVIVKRCVFPPV